MTMNRLITTIVQIVFGVPTFVMLYFVIKEIKQNGFFPKE